MKIIIVSNRLPISFKLSRSGKTESVFSPGGVAVGLSSYIETLKKADPDLQVIWLGWPGMEFVKESEQKVVSKQLRAKSLVPVFLSKEQIEKYYLGFSNSTLWPLFHYFPRLTVYKQEDWETYKKVNEKFAMEIQKLAKPGDKIWIHDYQLLTLPKILNEKLQNKNPIGFFLHIPFPTFEVFRLLPQKWREEILGGILGAHVVGFHTYDYAQYFLSCVKRILGYETDMDTVIMPSEQKVKVEVFPMGIDFEKYHSSSLIPKVARQISLIQKHAEGQKIIFSADRLDYTKGLINRLEAFEMFLKKYPTWHGKVQLVMVVSPSRTDIETFSNMKKQIDETIGKINGSFGKINWTPIIYYYKTFNFEEIAAYYALSDLALLTPLRDGMNLVAKEYIASRRNLTGSLILSEMAGAAQELGEALTVNPNHIEEICEAIYEALNMPREEQMEKNKIMQNRLQSYNLNRWANDFFDSLERSTNTENISSKNNLSSTNSLKILNAFKKASKKILFLDYDGTLCPYFKYPYLAKPTPDIKNLLEKLTNLPGTQVALVSGRDKNTLESWFNLPKIFLVAEHGAWLKNPQSHQWLKPQNPNNDWKATVMPILKAYVDRLPGSFIEEKEYSVAWHFRLSNPEISDLRSKELNNHLSSLSTNQDWQVSSGNKIIEVKSSHITKGSVVTYLLKGHPADFVLAAGDDITDEDMFKALPKNSFSIKVGRGQTSATYKAQTSQEIITFLSKLVKT
ncbi:MAG: bifunctional alpha,alpha-trehalose-phosphate synthase (UDP-forming)/trehalose-phosphatase [Candidatus Doudnabacteria bacterium]|nr:bifunctional alpha,alpha-trehalose-phosphate synthase (UDP-forming)/trehalose-phosphatase [Candidatus Doudnabacteria bacterium]